MPVTDSQSPSLQEKKPSRFYYGNIIVLASFFIFLTGGGAQYSFGVFFKPVLTEFGWTRGVTAGAYSLGMVLTGLLGFLSGRISDRFGTRIVLTACSLLIGLGYLLMSQVHAIWQVYLFYGVIISAGMGGMTVPLMASVAKWFAKGRGLASGIVVAGGGAGIVIVPPLANQLISSYSWRVSYIILGSIVLVLIMIVAQFMRRPPAPDSFQPRETKASSNDILNTQTRGYSLRQTLKARPFWIISTMGLLFGFCQQTVLVHVVAHATDIGFTATAAAAILSVIGFVSIGGNIVIGSLGDRIGGRSVMVLVFILFLLAFLLLLFAGELWMLYLFAVLFGLAFGGFTAEQSPLLAEIFGLRALGSIFGLSMVAVSIGGALGSLSAGSIFDISGSYLWAFIICGILGAGSIVLSILLKPVRK